MNATELADILEQHRLWLNGEGGKRANLTGANLTRANLTGADLARAMLARARLARANLNLSRGLLWAVAGPVGTDRRTVTGVWVDGDLVLHAGCFRGDLEDWHDVIDRDGEEWGWPTDDPAELARLQTGCRNAAAQIQASIHEQLAGLA